ncbi:MAG: protein translocase subunit SecD [Planctomycetota bacterium]|nr:protein translocase subunit SecD [Planctomycetota bacterium]
MNKLTNLYWKFALIGCVTLVGFFGMWPPSSKLKLGIDLSGGTILVYEVVKENLPATFNMDDVIAQLKKRLDPDGVRDIPIRKIGSYRFELILPLATPEEVDEVKRNITDTGSLEFRILANRKHDSAVIERALGPNGFSKPPARYKWARLGEVSSGENPEFSGLALVDPKQSWKPNLYRDVFAELTGKDATGKVNTVTARVKSNTTDTLTFADPVGLKTVTSYRVEYNPSAIRAGDPSRPSTDDPIIREEQVAPGRVERYILCNLDRQDVTGEYLSGAEPTTDERMQPAVKFFFNRKGGYRFGRLTSEHLPEEEGAFKYRLAILLDNIVNSAPSLNSEIRDQGVIEGGSQGFKAEEVQHLITILKSGSLPATINPVPLQEEKVGPTLGEDTIAKGLWAIGVSMIVVPFFMIIYYRFAGLVAVVALFMNMILLIGSMALMQTTFSLPGLAGLALTIGMAVDANVLVFERMREEKERGAGLPQQIRNGFNRAWVTIFDSHMTNFLSAIVLWSVGTEEVKGFAITMIIGMAWNLFTAVYVSRVIFEFWLATGRLKKLTMMRLLDKTNIDFIGPRFYCMGASLIVIAIGLVATVARGQGMYNIDFTGGTLVTIRLDENDPTVKKLSESDRAAFVRQKASALPDVTVESLKIGADTTLTRFNIRTTDNVIDHVKDVIVEVFGSALERVAMTAGPGKPIEKTASAASPSRFASGREYVLKFNTTNFNSTLPPEQTIAAIFARVLAEAKIANPDARVEVVKLRAQGSNELLLRTDLEPEVAEAQLKALATSLQSDKNLLFERITNFGGTVAAETRRLALTATIASWLIIIGYLWFRFKSLTYGLAAVIAVVHDVLVTLGAVALTYWLAQVPVLRTVLMLDQMKIDLPMIAAFLTLIGFSVNDTIVIFDRIRELKGKTPDLTSKIVNDAVNQTLSRTILTSFTAWLVVLILYVLGGEGLHGFAFALVVGFLSGTYSTVYIASPILIDWIGVKLPEKSAASGKKAIPATR